MTIDSQLNFDKQVLLFYKKNSQQSTECHDKIPQACKHFHHIKIV